MNENVKFEIREDKVVRIAPMPQYGQGICQVDVVMDKQTFIDCFNKWMSVPIEPQEKRILFM